MNEFVSPVRSEYRRYIYVRPCKMVNDTLSPISRLIPSINDIWNYLL